jgi:hypothetical protein
MTTNELERIFADAFKPARPVKKRVALLDPLVKLQKQLDELTAGMGMPRCELRKAGTSKRVGRKVQLLKQTEKRDLAFQLATGDESLGTRSAREIAGRSNTLKKAEAENAIELHSGFNSMGQLTGKE